HPCGLPEARQGRNLDLSCRRKPDAEGRCGGRHPRPSFRRDRGSKMTGGGLTHIDASGEASMVDVGDKAETVRVATAEGHIRMSAATLDLILAGNVRKGDVIGTARLAGIMAAKQTASLIPLCHPLMLSKVSVDVRAG